MQLMYFVPFTSLDKKKKDTCRGNRSTEKVYKRIFLSHAHISEPLDCNRLDIKYMIYDLEALNLLKTTNITSKRDNLCQHTCEFRQKQPMTATLSVRSKRAGTHFHIQNAVSRRPAPLINEQNYK